MTKGGSSHQQELSIGRATLVVALVVIVICLGVPAFMAILMIFGLSSLEAIEKLLELWFKYVNWVLASALAYYFGAAR